MKNLFFCLLFFFLSSSIASANDIEEVQKFFHDYVSAANSYSNDYFDYYCSDAKIIRVVEKPDGSEKSVDIPIERYKIEAKKTSKLAKLRKYKNSYSNISVFPCGGDYKITAMRMPSTSDYKVPAHFIVGKDINGNWKIKEESMNTKVQKFLKEG